MSKKENKKDLVPDLGMNLSPKEMMKWFSPDGADLFQKPWMLKLDKYIPLGPR